MCVGVFYVGVWVLGRWVLVSVLFRGLAVIVGVVVMFVVVVGGCGRVGGID